MSNHARGLWGYSGRTTSGTELTIQATGMGAPSAALVLADLAKLGVRRAIRVGTCAAVGDRAQPGELLLAAEAIALGGSAASFGLEPGATVEPEATLLARLRAQAGVREAAVASLDTIEGDAAAQTEAAAADMQTAAVLARGAALGVATAAVLIVSEGDGRRLDDERMEGAAREAGRVALAGLR